MRKLIYAMNWIVNIKHLFATLSRSALIRIKLTSFLVIVKVLCAGEVLSLQSQSITTETMRIKICSAARVLPIKVQVGSLLESSGGGLRCGAVENPRMEIARWALTREQYFCPLC